MVRFDNTDRLKTICLEVLENVKENTRTLTEDLNNFPIGHHFFQQIDRIKAMGEKYRDLTKIIGYCSPESFTYATEGFVYVTDDTAEVIISFADSCDYDLGEMERV